jgi:2'-5' RNA ligase
MFCGPNGSDRINSFSLVSYIPGRLGEFLDKLRQDLVSGCVAHAHVTVLPPRPLSIDQQTAEEELRVRVAQFTPTTISIPGIKIFESTSVVYAEIGQGHSELLEMHRILNTGELVAFEQFEYHPHITLAQGILPEDLLDTYEMAVRRWEEFAPSQSFVMDTLTFVQNTVENRWIDLADCEMRGEAAVFA